MTVQCFVQERSMMEYKIGLGMEKRNRNKIVRNLTQIAKFDRSVLCFFEPTTILEIKFN